MQNKSNKVVGSVCSGIEAASVAWKDIFDFKWFSEVADFPSKFLEIKYPSIHNIGDMTKIPELLINHEAVPVDIICGGTPCQAFSLAGWKHGLADDRGNLTLTFVDIVEQNDKLREANEKDRTIVLWENVEGVLRDKTNAFGCFVSSLGGFENELKLKRWPTAGYIHGPKRNIAWRLLDAKYFGLPQQRKRLYVVAGGKDYFPENVLFEQCNEQTDPPVANNPLTFEKEGHSIECFREYTDCLYSAYGTKWNGNAAAYNGSLYVSQNGRLRRFTPIECERLMGFPDNYTNLPKSRPTNRFQALGNSWAVPVVRWIGRRLVNKSQCESVLSERGALEEMSKSLFLEGVAKSANLSEGCIPLESNRYRYLNSSTFPCDTKQGNLYDIIDVDAEERFYITPVGCKGILRRREERGLTINTRLESILSKISSAMTDDEIERVSRRQKRGRLSSTKPKATQETTNNLLLPFTEEL